MADLAAILRGFLRGATADALGAPVDAAANAANLGIAGAGYLGHKAGVLDQPFPLIEKPVGGSEWIAERMRVPEEPGLPYAAGALAGALLPIPGKAPKAKKLDTAELLLELEKLTGDRNLARLKVSDAGVEVRNAMRKAKTLEGEPEAFKLQGRAAEIADLLDSLQPGKRSQHLFHTTTPDRLEAIRAGGLSPSATKRFPGVSDDAVYLAASKQAAKYFGSPGDVMLRTKKGAKLGDIEQDLLGGDASYLTRTALPPEALEVFLNGRWVPLK